MVVGQRVGGGDSVVFPLHCLSRFGTGAAISLCSVCPGVILATLGPPQTRRRSALRAWTMLRVCLLEVVVVGVVISRPLCLLALLLFYLALILYSWWGGCWWCVAGACVYLTEGVGVHLLGGGTIPRFG